jgi:hypothetical protein
LSIEELKKEIEKKKKTCEKTNDEKLSDEIIELRKKLYKMVDKKTQIEMDLEEVNEVLDAGHSEAKSYKEALKKKEQLNDELKKLKAKK